MATRLPLTRDEVRRGIGEYERLIRYIESRRRVEPTARMLQFPKLPNKLTECFIGELIVDGSLLSHLCPTDVTAGRAADIVVASAGGSYLVEVKATAQSFTMFSQKDLEADYLVWVDFGVNFRVKREVGIHLVRHLGGFGLLRNTKMTLPAFLKLTAGSAETHQYDWGRF